MGTRADFYVGRGPEAEWLGSIAFDGYPSGNPEPIFSADSEGEYRRLVEVVLASNDCATRPADGWPWPWPDSGTTDCAYAWDRGKVLVSWFGDGWAHVRPGKVVAIKIDGGEVDLERLLAILEGRDSRRRPGAVAARLSIEREHGEPRVGKRRRPKSGGKVAFPNMTGRSNVQMGGPRSGMLLVSFGAGGVEVR